MKKTYPLKATKAGSLYIDTTQPEFKEWFIEFVQKLNGRIKIKKITENEKYF